MKENCLQLLLLLICVAVVALYFAQNQPRRKRQSKTGCPEHSRHHLQDRVHQQLHNLRQHRFAIIGGNPDLPTF